MTYGSGEELRRELKREDITLAYQALSLRILCITLAAIYAVRGVFAIGSGQGDVATIFLVLAVLVGFTQFIPRWTHDYKHLGFIFSTFLLTVEAYLSVRLGKHYSLFLFLIPLAITYCSFMSGMLYGVLSAFIGVLEALFLIYYFSPAAQSGQTTYQISVSDFFTQLVATELLIALVLFIFQHVLNEGEEEIKIRRILRAKTARRAALAEVLGKLAHEVNNPLAILHSAFLRYRKIQKEGRLSELSREQLLGYMQEGNMRIQNVLDNLRAFTEGDLMEPMQTIVVQDLFWQVQQTSYERIRSSGARLKIDPLAPHSSIHGRPKQIFFILSVLLDNALDATSEEPGTVTLRFINGERTQRFEVEDGGAGISDDVAERIFQPFVSTKPFGQSMGMNLSICHGIAAEHSGQLGFVRKTRGTLFWLELPNGVRSEKEIAANS